MNELKAAQLRREFLRSLAMDLEKRARVLRVTRGRCQGHLTVALASTLILDVSALCFNQQPELTRVRVGSWIEATLLTEELAESVRGVASWLLVQAAFADTRYVWSPSAAATLAPEDLHRFETRRLIQPIAKIYDLDQLAELILAQVEQSEIKEAELVAQGRFQEAAAAQEDRLSRLDALLVLVGPDPQGVA